MKTTTSLHRAPGVAAMVTLALALATPVQAAPVGHWRFEGTAGDAVGLVANDLAPGFLDGSGEAGAIYSGSVVAGNIWDPTSGLILPNATSLDMQGGQRVRVPDDGLLDSPSFTIESFVKVADQGSWPSYVQHRQGSPSRGWQLDIDPDEDARARFDTDAQLNQVVGSGTAQRLADGGWHHTAVTFDATTKLITHYTDYTTVATRTLNGNASDATAVAADLILGGTGGWPARSAIDEVRYSNSVLSPEEFLRPGTIGYWRFEGAPGGTIGAVPNAVIPGLYDGAGEGGERFAADIPGKWITDPASGQMFANTSSLDLSTGGSVRVSDDPGLNAPAFTIEGFVKVQDQTVYPNFVRRLIYEQAGWQLDVDPEEDARARIDTGDTSPFRNQVVGSGSAQSLADYDWHHVALTYDGAQARIFVDYGNAATRTIQGDPQLVLAPATDLLFGSSTWPAGSALDEVRYSAGVLSPDQFLRVLSQGHWRFEGTPGAAVGTVPNVSQPGVLDGTGEGGAVYAADIPDTLIYDPLDGALASNASSLDIRSGQVRVQDDNRLDAPEFTMEAFVKVQDQGGWPPFIDRLNAGTGWQLDVNPDEYARARIDTAAQANQVVGSQPAQSLADHQWHHVALTFDGTQMQLYVDHSNLATRTLNGDPQDVTAVVHDLILGSATWPDGSFLDEARYTATVLRPEEFLRAVNVGHWRYEGTPGAGVGTVPNAFRPGDLDGTGEGGAIFAADIPGPLVEDPVNGSFVANTSSLDMNSGQVRVLNDGKLNTPQFTIETFVKVQDQGGYPSFITRLVGDTAGWQLDVDPEEDARARIDTGTGSLRNQVVGSGSAQSLADGGWHHVALTWDGAMARLYVDHANLATRAIQGDPANVYLAARDLILGSATWPAGSYIDESRLTALVLSPEQFLRIRDSAIVNGFWRMEGAPGAAATVIDSEVQAGQMQGTAVGSGLAFSSDIVMGGIIDPLTGTRLPNATSMRIGPGTQYFLVDPPSGLHEPASFTIEAFVKVDPETVQWQGILGKERPGGWAWLIDVRGAAGPAADQLAMRVDSQDSPVPGAGQTNQVFISGPDGVIKDGAWHHIAATFDDQANLFTLFVDYAEVGSFTLANGGELFYDGSPLWLGGSFTGYLDEVRLSNAVLAPSQFLRPVPEPATLTLVALGALGLLARRRKRA